MWDYRGGVDDGDVRHIDLVLLDTEVPHSYFVFLSSIHFAFPICYSPFAISCYALHVS